MASTPWSPEDDIRLNTAVLLHGTKNWRAVAASLGARPREECRARWVDINAVLEGVEVPGLKSLRKAKPESERKRKRMRPVPETDSVPCPCAEVPPQAPLRGPIDFDGLLANALATPRAADETVEVLEANVAAYLAAVSHLGAHLPAGTLEKITEKVNASNDEFFERLESFLAADPDERAVIGCDAPTTPAPHPAPEKTVPLDAPSHPYSAGCIAAPPPDYTPDPLLPFLTPIDMNGPQPHPYQKAALRPANPHGPHATHVPTNKRYPRAPQQLWRPPACPSPAFPPQTLPAVGSSALTRPGPPPLASLPPGYPMPYLPMGILLPPQSIGGPNIGGTHPFVNLTPGQHAMMGGPPMGMNFPPLLSPVNTASGAAWAPPRPLSLPPRGPGPEGLAP